MNEFKYSLDNKRYHTLNYYYKNKYNSKVSKISLNGNFTCPNIDGSKGYGGCIYCSIMGSGEFAGKKSDDIITQFNKIKKIEDRKWPNSKYIAYFQANTSTYGNIDKLKSLFEPVLLEKNVIGLSISTRCDCINDDVLEYLKDLNCRTNLTIELGLQSSKQDTLDYLNRCEDINDIRNKIQLLKKNNIEVVIHIIDGLPNESIDDMLNTIRFINSLDVDGIKIHMLAILKHTKLEQIYIKNKFHILTKDEYIDIVIRQLEILNPKIVIHRITEDPKIDDLIEPKWLINKRQLLNDIDKEMNKRKTYQGIYFR